MKNKKYQIPIAISLLLIFFFIILKFYLNRPIRTNSQDPNQADNGLLNSSPTQLTEKLVSTPLSTEVGNIDKNLFPEEIVPVLVKILPVSANEYNELQNKRSAEGRSWNVTHSMRLDSDKRGFYSLYLQTGEAIKTFPASINVSTFREPDKTDYNANNISWEWLDETRVIGVQEIDYRDDPDPYADVRSDNEITISAPGGAKIYLFDTTKLDTVFLLDVPVLPKGLAVRLDEVDGKGIILLSACSPIAYHQGSADMFDDPKHYRKLGYFRVEKTK